MSLSLLRSLQLASPGLPVGAYAYSQGLEWAVECGWVGNEQALRQWIADQLDIAVAGVDLPLLVRLLGAVEQGDRNTFAHWCDVLVANRETSELRADDRDRGHALVRLLRDLGSDTSLAAGLDSVPFAAAWALAAGAWLLPRQLAVETYCWSWLEAQVLAGVKLVPLGQVAGQRLLLDLAGLIPAAVSRGLDCADEDIGGSLTALALASAHHETQYTRLFRS